MDCHGIKRYIEVLMATWPSSHLILRAETLNGALRTSELARSVGRSPQYVRNLEREGVIPPSAREPNGYRRFSRGHLHALLAYAALSHAVGPVQAKETMRDVLTTPRSTPARLDALHAELHAERVGLQDAIAAAELISLENTGADGRNDSMTISELEGALGRRPSALRHWECEDLIRPARLPTTTYRSYSPADVRDARIVDQLRRAGYRIPALRTIMNQFRAQGPASMVQQSLDERLGVLDGRSLALLQAGAYLLSVTGFSPHRK